MPHFNRNWNASINSTKTSAQKKEKKKRKKKKRKTRLEPKNGKPQDRRNKIKLRRNQYKRGEKRIMKENSILSQKNPLCRKKKSYTDTFV
jgi:hypothetical protein